MLESLYFKQHLYSYTVFINIYLENFHCLELYAKVESVQFTKFI